MDWPRVPAPPAGAPNVVVILLDDVGFGQVSTFGGPVPTPALDKLAAGGLRYNRFHTTAICGPSRAAILTGRDILTIAVWAFWSPAAATSVGGSGGWLFGCVTDDQGKEVARVPIARDTR